MTCCVPTRTTQQAIRWSLCVLLLGSFSVCALARPVVAITSPANQGTVSGQAWINVAFRSDSQRPVVRLELQLDGRELQAYVLPVPLREGQKSFPVDFSGVQPGAYRLAVRGFDQVGETGTAEIGISISGGYAPAPTMGGPQPQLDRIPPAISIYYPAQGATVAGTVIIRAEVTDNVAVRNVLFYVDGKLHTIRMNSPPFQAEWDTTRHSEGPHVLEARSKDNSDNEGIAAPVTVIVENRAPQPAPGTTAPGAATTPGTQPAPATTPWTWGPRPGATSPGVSPPTVGPIQPSVRPPETTTVTPRPGGEPLQPTIVVPGITPPRPATTIVPPVVTPDPGAVGPNPGMISAPPEPIASTPPPEVTVSSGGSDTEVTPVGTGTGGLMTPPPLQPEAAIPGPAETRPAVPGVDLSAPPSAGPELAVPELDPEALPIKPGPLTGVGMGPALDVPAMGAVDVPEIEPIMAPTIAVPAAALEDPRPAGASAGLTRVASTRGPDLPAMGAVATPGLAKVDAPEPAPVTPEPEPVQPEPEPEPAAVTPEPEPVQPEPEPEPAAVTPEPEPVQPEPEPAPVKVEPEPVKPHRGGAGLKRSTPTDDEPEPVEPATEPVEPATEPAEPAIEPVEPATEPVEPATEPVEPATEPVEPATEPVAVPSLSEMTMSPMVGLAGTSGTAKPGRALIDTPVELYHENVVTALPGVSLGEGPGKPGGSGAASGSVTVRPPVVVQRSGTEPAEQPATEPAEAPAPQEPPAVPETPEDFPKPVVQPTDPETTPEAPTAEVVTPAQPEEPSGAPDVEIVTAADPGEPGEAPDVEVVTAGQPDESEPETPEDETPAVAAPADETPKPKSGLRRLSAARPSDTDHPAPAGSDALYAHKLTVEDAAKLQGAQVVFGGKVMPDEARPEAVGGVLMVSLKPLFEALDGAVYWFPKQRLARAVTADADLAVKSGSTRATLNGKTRELSVAPQTKDGRLLVPVDLISDALGLIFEFEPVARQVIIRR